MDNYLSFIPLGGIGDVTRNMYLYEYKDEVLIVDCGIGFADETMLGIDLLLPDITYLLQSKKRLVGLLLTHGHEDHIGALPFLLPQLQATFGNFPMYATPFTTSLINEKLREYRLNSQVQKVTFENNTVRMGKFEARFIRVTHSVPDTSHIVIKTPVGTIYHGSDYKFDDTPYDNKISDYEKISKTGENSVIALMIDCLGSERQGKTPSEAQILDHFVNALSECKGKVLITTYSSHVARINQIIEASRRTNRKVCFVGRSLLKIKDVGKKLGYIELDDSIEVNIDEIDRIQSNQLTLIIAGSQGQEDSAMTRIANGIHQHVRISEHDLVIFSSDPIPGNELSVYDVIDTISRKGTRVLYSPLRRDFHVSGHGSQDDITHLISLVKPKYLVPIGGSFRHMVAFKDIAEREGFKKEQIFLLDDGKEVIFSKEQAREGRSIPAKSIYVDQTSGEEVEKFVLRDRQKLSEAGIVIVLVEIDSTNGQLLERADVIARGIGNFNTRGLVKKLTQDLKNALSSNRHRVTNWVYIRRLIGDIAERRISKDLRSQPLVLPVVIEV